MRSITGHANTWFVPTLRELVSSGDEVTVRGPRDTREWLHVTTHLPNPRLRVVTVPFRRANPFFQLAETVWILGGRSDAKWITRYNSQLSKFLDKDPSGVARQHFHGAYGERLRAWGRHNAGSRMRESGGYVDQIELMLTQLLADPSSRRACAVLHNPDWDRASEETNDRPCNIAITVQWREDGLWMTTFNRSNDLVLGLSYTNLTQFTVIQEFMAAALGTTLGGYSHFSSSFHAYVDDPIALRVLGAVPDASHYDVYEHVSPTEMAPWPDSGHGNRIVAALLQDVRARLPIYRDSDPYWQGVQDILITWDWLRKDVSSRTALVQAMSSLPSCGIMDDWTIACLEFMHRWAVNRRLEEKFLSLLNARHGYLDTATQQYITHDRAASPWSPPGEQA